jgi:hypothetical protein
MVSVSAAMVVRVIEGERESGGTARFPLADDVEVLVGFLVLVADDEEEEPLPELAAWHVRQLPRCDVFPYK